MNFNLITNNSVVVSEYLNKDLKNLNDLVYLEGKNYLEVLEYTRDLIHKGHKLLTHPLSSSIKPFETPYKSILISTTTHSLDKQSLDIIESSIETSKKFVTKASKRNYTEQHHNDFKIIDYRVIQSGIESCIQFN